MKKQKYILYKFKSLYGFPDTYRLIKVKNNYVETWDVDWVYHIESNYLDKNCGFVPKLRRSIVKQYNNITDVINDYPQLILS